MCWIRTQEAKSDVFCCILKKNKIQITLINQKLSRHQSIYWCIGVLGTARIQKYIVSTLYIIAANINMSVRSILRILPLQSFVIFVTFNCDEICWGVSCAVLTANLLPVVRYVPTFHPSEANELINLPLTPSSSEHLLSPSPTGRGEMLSPVPGRLKQSKGREFW